MRYLDVKIRLMKPINIRYILTLVLFVACGSVASAFSEDTYASKSVLKSGRWVRISVQESGMHLISNADLSAWGFSDPSKVRVYGYGGERIPDQLTRSSYIDDLPMVQTEATKRGIVFYAKGPFTREELTSTTHRLVQNPYTSLGYYYLSDIDASTPTRDIPVEGRQGAQSTPATSFIESVRHESELVSPNRSGHLIVGEDFRFTPTRKFNFSLPGRVGGTDNTVMLCNFYAKTSGYVQLTFTANGNTVSPNTSDRVNSTDDWGSLVSMSRELNVTGETLDLTLTASSNGLLSQCYLDNITICYERSIALPSSRCLHFTATGTSVALSGATESTRVWDVTDPVNIVRMNVASSGSTLSWTNDYYGRRFYAAWDDNATFLTPRLAGNIKNQNIHGEQTPDMVIITHSALRAQAQRVAKLHAESADSLRVLVVTPEEVANEFGCGSMDINAMRRMLKMFYDRGADAKGHRLQYALMMGSVIYDHRRVTSGWRNSSHATVPIWQTDNGCQANYSYSTDDALASLEDGSGVNLASDKMCIAVGRIPARNADEAKVFVDRLVAYSTAPASGRWRNRLVLVADDENNNDHMEQTEDMLAHFMSYSKGTDMTFHKVYLDNYPKVGGVTKVGREKLHNLLDDGVVWWNYVGHSSATSNSGEGILTLTDLSNLYLRKAPFYYGATCNFVRWDSDEYSGLETLALTEAGGIIGGISATREVYISRNGVLTKALGKELFVTDDNFNLSPIGEVLRRAKNSIGYDTNRLRYVLLGDPAMRLAIPALHVSLDSINSRNVMPDDGVSDPLVITALGETRLQGSVRSADGLLLDTFNGYVDLTLYDAEQSYTTNGRGADKPYVFEDLGEQLYMGRARVTAGKWDVTFVLPAEIADNYRNATLSMSAKADDSTLAAVGANRDFYVYGYDDDAVIDDVAPSIDALYLNHDSFRSGDVVNSTPMLMARVSDDKGINLALGGIGHQLSVTIDGVNYFGDVSTHYTPDADGIPAGDIVYQLPELSAGDHTAMLKVWDIGGNSTTASIDFSVDLAQSPKIFDVYSDANPASVEANFYIVHNRPDAMLSVKIEVYDMMGRLVWSDTTRGRADMYLATPVNWNLRNSAGQPVGRGIYVYRATVITEAAGDTPATSSSVGKRIAVAPM